MTKSVVLTILCGIDYRNTQKRRCPLRWIKRVAFEIFAIRCSVFAIAPTGHPVR